MKTLKISLIAAIITAIVIAICGIATASAEGIYPLTAKVVEIDESTDMVTVVTFTGFTFSFFGCEEWEVGDGCSLIMGDNGTELIYDDYIIKAEYCAWDLVNWWE